MGKSIVRWIYNIKRGSRHYWINSGGRNQISSNVFILLYLGTASMFVSSLYMWYALFAKEGPSMDFAYWQKHVSVWMYALRWYVQPFGNYIPLIFATVWSMSAWLLSTRVKAGNISLFRRRFFFISAFAPFVSYANVFACAYLRPITYDYIMRLDDNTPDKYATILNTGGLELLGTLLMILPVFVSIAVMKNIYGIYKQDEVIRKWFSEYTYQSRWIGRFADERAYTSPDLNLAKEAETGNIVTMGGDSRQLGTLLIGPPGSGKTSLKIIKAFSQDMAHLQQTINRFPEIVKKHGMNTREFHLEMGKQLIASVIIEPAKDLCDKAYEIAVENGIPKEFIVYLDPSNPDTNGFNVLKGPVEQVAETIASILDGMSEVSNEFFRQACRTVLKNYIYLLKFVKKDECTIFDLDEMYQDPRFCYEMVEQLRKMLPPVEEIKKMSIDHQIVWRLVDRTLRWFDNDGLSIERDFKSGMVLKFESGKYKGKEKVLDKQAEFTKQTRNLISDLITNPYLTRILTKDNDVDLDRLMSVGGVLLCNTDNGLLANVSDAFGKMVLLSVQNAVFRRGGDENTRPLVSLYVDEVYDYINAPFLKLAGQGRKYKIAPFIACQSLSQFAIKFDDKFVEGMIGTVRNMIVYGGVGEYDAKKISVLLGTHVVDEMTIRETITPETMEKPNYNYSESTTRTEMELVTQDEIMFNPFKYSYIRMVVEGSTKKGIKAEGDFLDVSKRDIWKKELDAQALTLYMNYFYGYQGRDSAFSMSRITVDGEELGAEQIDDHFATTRAVVKQAQGTFIEQAVTKSVAVSYPLLANEESAVALEATAGSHDLLPKASSYVYQKKTFVPVKEVPSNEIEETLSKDIAEDQASPVVKITQPAKETILPKNEAKTLATLFGSIPNSTPITKQEVPLAESSTIEPVVIDPICLEPVQTADLMVTDSLVLQETCTMQEPLQTQEEKGILPVIATPPVKKKRKMEELEEVGVDVTKNAFLSKLFKQNETKKGD